MTEPFDRKWPLAPIVIDYIAAQADRSEKEWLADLTKDRRKELETLPPTEKRHAFDEWKTARACLDLQRQLIEGSVRACGPIRDQEGEPIDRAFWRFTVPEPNGSAVNVVRRTRLPWFEVNAEDVIKAWPPAPASKNGERFPPVSKAELRRFVESNASGQKKPELLELTMKHFGGRSVPLRAFNEIYGGLPAEKRRNRGETDRTVARRGRQSAG